MKALLLMLVASPALAAPKIDVLAAKPDAEKPEVVLTIAVTKSGGNCDVRVNFGDGKGRMLDFGMATTRTLRYAYARAGSYKVSVQGTGKLPCEGAKEIPVKVVSAPAQKKAAEKKKAEKKKADKKSASAKKDEPK